MNSLGHCSMTSASSVMLVASKTMVERAFDFHKEAEASVATDRRIHGMKWTPSPEQGEKFLCSDKEAGCDSTDRSYVGDFMVDDTLSMAPRHAQFLVNCFNMAHNFDHSCPAGALSIDGLALDAKCSEKVERFPVHSAPVLEQEQLLRLDCKRNLYVPERYVENMAPAGNKGLMTTRQSLGVESMPETIEFVKQRNASSNSSGTFLEIKYLSDLVTQTLSLLLYSTLVMVRLCHRAICLACSASTD